MIRIPISDQIVDLARNEYAHRSPHMLHKNPNRDAGLRMFARASGMLIEAAVSSWFQSRFPDLYVIPDNYQIWDRPCSHDFKLKLPDRLVLVDVSGPNRHGEYRPRVSKKSVDLHLLAYLLDREVVWHTVVTGAAYLSGDWTEARSAEDLVELLDAVCQADRENV